VVEFFYLKLFDAKNKIETTYSRQKIFSYRVKYFDERDEK